jgi:FkbM family methyltransferase
MAEHHPIFSSFTPFRGAVPPNFAGDYIGAKISHEFVAGLAVASQQCEYTATTPEFDEEYFEWIALLEAVAAAQGCFTMIELGAGFGRWVVRGGLAAKQRGLAFKLVAVEAEPAVYAWLRQHFANNGIPPEEHMLLNGAATENAGEVRFNIAGPRGSEWDERNPNGWYGQHMTATHDLAVAGEADGSYYGLPVLRHATGWRSIGVPGVSLSGLLRKLDMVDLIDMDIEGEELPIVTTNIKTLNRQVKRLHIGTHSKEIEAGLREVLGSNGWQCTADYSLFSKAQTPFGEISFENGAQTWVNPREVSVPGLTGLLRRWFRG